MSRMMSSGLLAFAFLAALPLTASAQGVVTDVGNGVGAVVEGTGDALFGDRDTTVVVEEDRTPDVVVQPAPVIVEDRTPDAVIVDTPDTVVVK